MGSIEDCGVTFEDMCGGLSLGDNSILMLCNFSARSSTAAMILREHGLNAYYLVNGLARLYPTQITKAKIIASVLQRASHVCAVFNYVEHGIYSEYLRFIDGLVVAGGIDRAVEYYVNLLINRKGGEGVLVEGGD